MQPMSSIDLGSIGSYLSLISDGSNWFITEGQQDSGWITPTLLNSWTEAIPVGYRLTGNIVRFKGAIKDGTMNTTAFNLPIEF